MVVELIFNQGAQWKALSTEDKKPYEDQAAESKKEAKQALAEYTEKVCTLLTANAT
jgi:hypothetical protein